MWECGWSDNAASNALCRTLGFTLLGPVDVEYPKGSVMHSYDWCLDLARPPQRMT